MPIIRGRWACHGVLHTHTHTLASIDFQIKNFSIGLGVPGLDHILIATFCLSLLQAS